MHNLYLLLEMRERVLDINDGMRQYPKLVEIIEALLTNDSFNVITPNAPSIELPIRYNKDPYNIEHSVTFNVSKGGKTAMVHFFKYTNDIFENRSGYMIEVDSDDDFFDEVNDTIQKVKGYTVKPLPESDGGVWDKINRMIGDNYKLTNGGRVKKTRRAKKTRRSKRSRRARKTRRT
jgi:hypothetical protein